MFLIKQSRGAQRALFCWRCAFTTPTVRGLCTICYRESTRDRVRFGGHRQGVVARDSARCRVCGAEKSGRSLHVHHRIQGVDAPEFLVTLCAACHARVHRLAAVRKWLPDELIDLWREQHPGTAVQMQLALTTSVGQEVVAA
jgi:5-methylcytosine-specific restriction endonuclease McrA